MQINFMFYEMETTSEYASVFAMLKSNASSYDMAVKFCDKYEHPDGSCYDRANRFHSSIQAYVNNGCK